MSETGYGWLCDWLGLKVSGDWLGLKVSGICKCTDTKDAFRDGEVTLAAVPAVQQSLTWSINHIECRLRFNFSAYKLSVSILLSVQNGSG